MIKYNMGWNKNDCHKEYAKPEDDYIGIEDVAGQYVDLLNVTYIKMPKEKRLKSLSSIAKRIVEFRYNKDHNEIKDIVTSAAKEYKCDPREIRLQGIEYPEDIEW